jgi:hypothetical protein
MANASMKWNEHVVDILGGIQANKQHLEKQEEEDELAERGEEDEEDQ